MEINDDRDFEKEEDISLDMLREDVSKFGDIHEKEYNRKQVFVYIILGVITFALCGISFIIGVKMGRNLERNQMMMKEETLISSNLDNFEPVPSPEFDEKSAEMAEEGSKSSSLKQEKPPVEIKEVEKGSSEFMILQNAKESAPKERTEPKRPETSKKVVNAKTENRSKPASKEQLSKPSWEYFTIQIAATSDKEQAENLKSKMIKKGYDAYVSTIIVRNKIFYRIRIGKYKTEEEALKAAEILKSKEKLENDVWVTNM